MPAVLVSPVVPAPLERPAFPVPDEGWPSTEEWVSCLALEETFRRAIEPELRTPSGDGAPELLAHAGRFADLADRRVDADVRPFFAYDFERARWIPGGWPRAAEEANALLDACELAPAQRERELAWSRAMESGIGFWEPPLPARGFACSAFGQQTDGRIRARGPAFLRHVLEESTYREFLNGGSAVDFLFEELEPGAIAGPFETSHGLCVLRLLRRTVLPEHGDAARLERIESEFVRRRFVRYAHEALEAAELVGISPPTFSPRVVDP